MSFYGHLLTLVVDLCTVIMNSPARRWAELISSVSNVQYYPPALLMGWWAVEREGCFIFLWRIGSKQIRVLKMLFSSNKDYNDQVIEHITMPNVLLNFSDKSNFRFFSGDWKNLEERLKQGSLTGYDVILTSETIYNVQNYDKLVCEYVNTPKRFPKCNFEL